VLTTGIYALPHFMLGSRLAAAVHAASDLGLLADVSEGLPPGLHEPNCRAFLKILELAGILERANGHLVPAPSLRWILTNPGLQLERNTWSDLSAILAMTEALVRGRASRSPTSLSSYDAATTNTGAIVAFARVLAKLGVSRHGTVIESRVAKEIRRRLPDGKGKTGPTTLVLEHRVHGLAPDELVALARAFERVVVVDEWIDTGPGSFALGLDWLLEGWPHHLSLGDLLRSTQLAGLQLRSMLNIAGPGTMALTFTRDLAETIAISSILRPTYGSDPCPCSDGPIVVVAPHADDEVLGCGGLLSWASQLGMHCHVLQLTATNELRSSEAAEVDRLIGVTRRAVLGQPERAIDFSRLREWLDYEITTLQPSVLAIPNPSDPHPDHLIVHEVLRSLTISKKTAVLAYEGLVPLERVTHYLDLRAVAVRKFTALKAYRTQARFGLEEAARHLAAFRSTVFPGRSPALVEAYRILSTTGTPQQSTQCR
jgi:LmbE family N-acetylglucosaminyl deacetylase